MDEILAGFRWDWPIVGLLLVFAGVAAWKDFRTGKIPNRLLAVLMVVVALWVGVLVVLVSVFPDQFRLIHPLQTVPDYLLAIARNGALGFLIGLALWIGGLWAAGDSKLFPLLCLALPLHHYADQYVALWPGFVLFYNIVMVSLAIILVDLVVRIARALRTRVSGRRDEAPTEKKAPWGERFGAALRSGARTWGGLLLMFVAVFVFIKALRGYLSDMIGLVVELDQTILYVVLFFLCHPLLRLLSRPWVLAVVAGIDAVLIGLALSGLIPDLTVASLFYLSMVSVVVILFRILYDSYQQRMDYIELDVEELRPRMLLSEQLRDTLKGDKAYFEAQEEELGALLPDGLKEEQVALVKRWLRERAPGRPVQVQKTLPMAPSIFLGLLITVVWGDYIINFGR